MPHRSCALTPEVRAFWVPQLADRSSQMVTIFKGGGPSFVVSSGDYGWQHFRLGTGVNMQLSRTWSAFADYDAMLYSRQTLQSGVVGVTARF